MTSHLGFFVLSHIKGLLNKFGNEENGFHSKKVYYQSADSLYFHMDLYEKFKEAGFVGNKLRQWKNDYGDCGFFNGLILAPKMKLCYTMDKYGTIVEKITFKWFPDSKRLLDSDR